MLDPTVTHYFPWTENDTFAYCGYRMTEADVSSTQPTCPACAARQAAEEQAIENTPLPLDADEARTELEPVRNPSLADDLFAWAVDLTRSYAATLVPAPVDPLAAHRAGECDHGCGYCAELTTLHADLVRLFGARRPDLDRLEEIEARLTTMGDAHWIACAQRDAELADEARRDEAVGR